MPVQASSGGADQTYLIVYKDGTSSAGAPSLVQAAGGTLVYNYPEIGVAIVKSNHNDFATKAMADSRVEAVASSNAGATRIRDGQPDGAGADGEPAVTPAPGDSLSGLQWDMKQIHAFEAQAINPGRRSVVVGDIDTGADYTHPDLSPNIDFSKSVSCIGGVPNTSPAAWKDDNGHGTHTAGTIAAARNGSGIVGVAPNVRLAIIKSGDSQGFFFPETVVCAFMWAGKHHLNVTNNSYFADPFYWNCPSDPAEKAILVAETRAIRFSERAGVLNVAAEGNFSDDLANPTQDRQSPDTLPIPPTRPVDKSCIIVPTEVRGVLAVTADGNKLLKSFYSNYGFGLTQVTAPGGDSVLQSTTDAPNGRVLSSWPSYIPCGRKVVENGATYCYAQGTSMASPHVAGVAALIESTGVRDPETVKALMTETADALPCPTAQQLALYAPFPSANNDAPQKCTGGTEFNGWYGFGQVNALAAVAANSEDHHGEGGRQ
ncbi:MAG TPA: S8 family serine peptidase [Candidatus Dormibacteraeota bacterium]|nr:S8 family serine peptidase [Candidatus Dormibacteraeota bacterium]